MKAEEAINLATPIIDAVFEKELERVINSIKKRASKGERQLYIIVDHRAIEPIEQYLLGNGFTVKKTQGRSYNIIIWW